MSRANRRGCPLCGAEDPKPLLRARDPDRPREGPYLVSRCRACDLVFVCPQPTADEHLAAYGPDFYSGPTAAARVPFRLAQRLLLTERVRLVERWAPRGRLLDIGCGDGAFLEEMIRRGFAGDGVEDTDSAAARARERGLHVDVGPVADIAPDRPRYSAVTLWHVLEHLPDPRRTLAACRRLLLPDGVLVLSVPNFASVQARLFGRHWFHLDVPRHRVHFEPHTLRRLLDRSGFAVVHSRQMALEYNPYGMLQSAMNLLIRPNHLYHLLRRNAAPGKHPLATAASLALAPALAPAALVFSTMTAAFGYGATITVVARRQDG